MKTPVFRSIAGFLAGCMAVGTALAQGPSLTIEFAEPHLLRLSWPTSAKDFLLEETDTLNSASSWRLTLEVPQISSENYTLILPPTDARRYFRLHYRPETGLPPDPATVAPPLSAGVATDLGTAAAFLYTGPYPVQTGVTNGTIEPRRTAVLRGTVLEADGRPLPSARLTILGRPELGSTLSRADGQYDLVVNGGGTLHLNVHLDGYLDAQRPLAVPWSDHLNVPPIRLLKRDAKSTVLQVGLPDVAQIAQGSVVMDLDGQRQAAVLMSPGTSAGILTPGGTTQAVSRLTTRITEYTVGQNGPENMPGPLPPMVGYTYAVEISADEAQAKIAGRDVLFDQPVFFYVDNFIGIPAGVAVPSAYYNKDRGAWVPSSDGRAITLLGTDPQGLALVDADGDELPDSEIALQSLGFSAAERRTLGATYAPAVTNHLWRVPIRHFSTYDLNYGTVPETGSVPPTQMIWSDQIPPTSNPTTVSGYGDIDIENRVFREFLPLVGTPFRLHYSSARVPGFRRSASVTIPLTGSNVPPSLLGVKLELRIGGRTFRESFDASPLRSYDFEWDGLDVYERPLVGSQMLTIRIGYEYPAYYALPPALARGTFGLASGARIPGDIRARDNAILWQELQSRLEAQPPLVAQGLGGWTISVHHAYDPSTRRLYEGTGRELRSDRYPYNVAITTVAGNGSGAFSGDDGPATQAGMLPWGVAVRPNGELIFSDYGNHRLRRINTQGIVTAVAGNGTAGFSGDGGAATAASLKNPSGVAFAPDGAIYFVDQGNNRIRRIGLDGIITTVAGNGTASVANETNGIPATESRLSASWGIAVAADGTLYFTDRGSRIRRVGPDGIISTFAGGGTYAFRGENSPAIDAWLYNPHSITLGPDGTVWFNDAENYRVRRVTPDGLIHTVAGTGRLGYNGDGIPATEANLFLNWGLAVTPDGICYIADGHQFSRGSWRIRRVGQDGIITTIAGTGVSAFSGDGGPAANAQIAYPMAMALAPDGVLYFADHQAARIRKIYSMLPGSGIGEVLIPAEDGSEVYQFSSTGRHLRTLHGLTGVTLYEFGYSASGQLQQITDIDGQVTTIDRDISGNPLAVTAPHGQRTTFTVDARGYLAAVRNPGGETVQLIHTPDGLLTSVIGARGPGFDYAISYGPKGELQRVQDPAGGSSALQLSTETNFYAVTATSAESLTRIGSLESLATGERRRTQIAPDNSRVDTVLNPDGTETVTAADGTVTRIRNGPDPRFGMLSPVAAETTVRLPSGLATTNRVEWSLAPAANLPFGVGAITNIHIINGQAFVSVYAAESRTLTETTPLGRSARVQTDSAGRPIREETPGMEPVLKAYNAAGQPTTLTMGTGASARVTRYTYDTLGNLAAIVDPLARTNEFTYDAVGRAIGKRRPDGSAVGLAYDAHGNLVGLTPPGRPQHTFQYNAVDLLIEYSPPSVPGATNSYRFTYNLDRQLVSTRLPDGRSIVRSYDAGGRLAGISLTNGDYVFGYGTNGRVASVSAPAGVKLALGYDGPAQTTTEWSGPIAGTVVLTYDALLQVRAITVNATNIVDMDYDSDGLLTQAGEIELTWHPQNRQLASATVGNATTSWQRNPFDELIRQIDTVSGNGLYSADYERDALGRITRKVEVVAGVTNIYEYSYTETGWLRSASKDNSQTRSYTYDPNGNCVSRESDSLQATTLIYDDQDRLLQQGETTYRYGANGELQTKEASGETTRYGYDALGNLLSVTRPDGTLISYLVDGLNRRVGKKVNGILTQAFLYDGTLRPVAELDANLAVVSIFIYGTRANVPDYMVRSGVTYRLITDDLGSPRLVVDARTGVIAQRLDYDEWGQVTHDSHPGFQPFGFSGGLYDPDTGLVRFRARDYDAETGRWTAKDPQFFGGFSPNLYVYAFNDPVNSTDLTGMGPGKPPGRPPMAPGQQLTASEAAQLQFLSLHPNPFVSTPAAFAIFTDTASQWAHGNAAGYMVVHDGANVVANSLGFLPGVGTVINNVANIVDVSSQFVFGAAFNAIYNPNLDVSHLRPNSDQDASTYSGLGAFK